MTRAELIREIEELSSGQPDITGRIEEDLLNQRDHLDKIINSIGDPLFVKDREHRLVLVNDAECSLLGHKREEIIGKTDYDFLPKEQVEIFWKQDDIVFATGEENINEENITDAQGKECTIVTKKTLYTDKAGRQFIVGIIRDITARKKAEEALHHRLKIEELVTNISSRFINLNMDEFAQGIEWALENIRKVIDIDRSFINLYSGDLKRIEDIYESYSSECKPMSEYYRKISVGITFPWASKKFRSFEYICANRITDLPPEAKSEKEIWQKHGIMSLLIIPMVSGKSLLGILGFTSEKTETTWKEEDIKLLRLAGDIFVNVLTRKRSYGELRKSEEKFRNIYESSPIGLEYYSSDGRLVSTNKACLDIFGVSDPLEVTGFRLFDDPNLPDDIKVRLHNCETVKYEISFDFEKVKKHRLYKTKKSGIIYLLVIITPLGINEKGTPDNYLVQVQDITERKGMEKTLQKYSAHLEEMVEKRTEELRNTQEKLIRQEKLAVLGQMAGGVGHELRNPLGVISNAVYFLKMTLPEANSITGEYLEMISEETRRIEKIISDLLDFSRIKSIDREEVKISFLIGEVLKRLPPPEKVNITDRITPDIPSVFVDPQKTEQVLLNLIGNAYQSMPEGGEVTISAVLENKYVRLSITDTGCGISEENLKKIFEPLFTTRARGIGLGLAVSKNLVEVNGGKIEAESVEGKGSTFTITLPVKE